MTLLITAARWRRVVVVIGVLRMNEVNPRRARLVLRWVGISSRNVTNQLGQLSLSSPGVAKSSTSLAGIKAGMSRPPGGR